MPLYLCTNRKADPTIHYETLRFTSIAHLPLLLSFFFLNNPAPTEISPLPLPAPLPIYQPRARWRQLAPPAGHATYHLTERAWGNPHVAREPAPHSSVRGAAAHGIEFERDLESATEARGLCRRRSRRWEIVPAAEQHGGRSWCHRWR